MACRQVWSAITEQLSCIDLLGLAIVDDIGAIAIIAAVYSNGS